MTDDLDSQYERLQALLAGTERTLQRVITLHDKQRACVDRLAHHGARVPQSQGILAEMAKTVQILRWQKAWLRTFLRRNSHLALREQPHPWATQPPPDLLQRICFEMRQLPAAARRSSAEATEHAVEAAFARATAR